MPHDVRYHPGTGPSGLTHRIAPVHNAGNVETWDCLVVGAGPAGAFTARQLALAGHATLLVDAKPFPRDKVCGGCLSGRGVSLLERSGLGDALAALHPLPLERFQLACGGRRVEWPIEGMLAIRRSTFDAMLVNEAVAAGAEFRSGHTARVLSAPDEEYREALLTSRGGARRVVRARVVVCADGLGHPSLAELPEFSCKVHRHSRVGLQAILQDDSTDYTPGVLAMAVGKHGYVGVTRLADGSLNVAAAVERGALAEGPSPAHLIAELLRGTRLPIPQSLHHAAWRGTAALTQQSRAVAGRRIFVVGDSAGYVEPFTGEGMTWALESADALTPLAGAACRQWSDSLEKQWHRLLIRKVTGRQWMCRLVTEVMHRPRWTLCAMHVCRMLPSLSGRIVRRFTAAPPHSADRYRPALPRSPASAQPSLRG